MSLKPGFSAAPEDRPSPVVRETSRLGEGARRLTARFARRVEESPASPALICGDHIWSYRALAVAGHELARRLGAWGVGRRCLVALVMERGWEQLVGVLGVAAAGASFAILDARSPPAVLRGSLEQLGVEAVLSQPSLAARLANVLPPRTLLIERKNRWGPGDFCFQPLMIAQGPDDPLWRETPREEGTTEGSQTPGAAPSYVSYRTTSGLVDELASLLGWDSEDRLLMLAPAGSRPGFLGLFSALLTGGTVLVPKPAEAAEPAEILALMEDYEATALAGSSDDLMALLEHALGRQMTWANGRSIVLASDWLPVRLPDLLRRFAPGAKLAVLRQDPGRSRPLQGFRVDAVEPGWTVSTFLTDPRFTVLNEALEPCPPEEAGQLFAAGLGEERAWRPSLAVKARMVTAPGSGQRLYRTGHRGRFTSTGEIEFAPPSDLPSCPRHARDVVRDGEATLDDDDPAYEDEVA